MAATGVPRRPGHRPPRLAAATVFAVTVVAVGGCGGDPEPTPAPATGSPVAPAPPTVDPVGAAADAEFPDTAREYAEAAVAAWAAPDLIRLARLTTPEVQDEIIELAGPPDQDWTFIACEDADLSEPTGPAGPTEPPEPTDPPGSTDSDQAPAGTGDSACSFHNADGDHLTMAVAHGRLAAPSAVQDVTFEPTTYPEEPLAYVQAFVEAWLVGNPPRMSRLAVTNAATAFYRLPDAGAAAYEVADSDDRMVTIEVVLTPTAADAEEETTAQLRLSRSRLGEPLAIRLVTVIEPA